MKSWISAARHAAYMSSSVTDEASTPRRRLSRMVPWKRVGSWETREMCLR